MIDPINNKNPSDSIKRERERETEISKLQMTHVVMTLAFTNGIVSSLDEKFNLLRNLAILGNNKEKG